MSASGDVSDLMVLAENSYLPDHGMFLHFRGSELQNYFTKILEVGSGKL